MVPQVHVTRKPSSPTSRMLKGPVGTKDGSRSGSGQISVGLGLGMISHPWFSGLVSGLVSGPVLGLVFHLLISNGYPK
jgi:hypothetical protein